MMAFCVWCSRTFSCFDKSRFKSQFAFFGAKDSYKGNKINKRKKRRIDKTRYLVGRSVVINAVECGDIQSMKRFQQCRRVNWRWLRKAKLSQVRVTWRVSAKNDLNRRTEKKKFKIQNSIVMCVLTLSLSIFFLWFGFDYSSTLMLGLPLHCHQQHRWHWQHWQHWQDFAPAVEPQQ